MRSEPLVRLTFRTASPGPLNSMDSPEKRRSWISTNPASIVKNPTVPKELVATKSEPPGWVDPRTITGWLDSPPSEAAHRTGLLVSFI